jgi:hypothetical protein
LISFVTPASKERLKNRLYRRRRNPIVVDRRGTRDIVTSYAGIAPFCDDNYGRIFETAGALAGMSDWKMPPAASATPKSSPNSAFRLLICLLATNTNIPNSKRLTTKQRLKR